MVITKTCGVGLELIRDRETSDLVVYGRYTHLKRGRNRRVNVRCVCDLRRLPVMYLSLIPLALKLTLHKFDTSYISIQTSCNWGLWTVNPPEWVQFQSPPQKCQSLSSVCCCVCVFTAELNWQHLDKDKHPHNRCKDWSQCWTQTVWIWQTRVKVKLFYKNVGF